MVTPEALLSSSSIISFKSLTTCVGVPGCYKKATHLKLMKTMACPNTEIEQLFTMFRRGPPRRSIAAIAFLNGVGVRGAEFKIFCDLSGVRFLKYQNKKIYPVARKILNNKNSSKLFHTRAVFSGRAVSVAHVSEQE